MKKISFTLMESGWGSDDLAVKSFEASTPAELLRKIKSYMRSQGMAPESGEAMDLGKVTLGRPEAYYGDRKTIDVLYKGKQFSGFYFLYKK